MGKPKKSNSNKFQTFQNIALSKFIKCPSLRIQPYTHSDLKMPLVYDKAKTYYKRFHLRLPSHPNLLA